MKFNHKNLLEKIFDIKLAQKTQTRDWLSRFMKLYSRQNS